MMSRATWISLALCLSLGAAHAQTWTTPARGSSPASVTRRFGSGSGVMTQTGYAVGYSTGNSAYRDPRPKYTHTPWKAKPKRAKRVSSLKKSIQARKKKLQRAAQKRKRSMKLRMKKKRLTIRGKRNRTLY